MEEVNLGNEELKSSRRRLSSILKACRTSMKVPGGEQEEQQEEVTKPIEKKRNSRRVSFAATKNVRVFSSDAKSESPILASVQNTAVGDLRQDEKILRFVEEGNNQIKGLDTLLNTPLYVSQHLGRGNFFSDPILQDDCVDGTMLLGEETGYMDMTHSHTITIDKDYEIEEVNPDFGLKAAQKAIGDQNVAGQKRLSCGTKVETKNPNLDSDFNAFLTSISLPTVKNILPSSSKQELGGTNTSVIDKENHLPSFLLKQGNPEPKGLQRRRSRVAFFEGDDMEVTTSHTAVIENRSNAQPVLSFVSGNNGSVASTPAFSHDDDMELTQSQTAAINVKLTGNISRNIQSALDHNRSHYFSENADAMEMTGMFDVSRQEKEHAISMKEETSISKASKISHYSVPGNGEIMDRNKPEHFQSNLSIVQTANSDDMEMTEALDVSVQEKEHTASMKNESLFLFPKISKKSTFNVIGNAVIVDQNKSSHLSVAQSANYDDMEMTQCQTIVLESKQFSGDKSLINTRKSLPHASMSSSVQDKEHTASLEEGALLQIHRPSNKSSIRNEEIMVQNKSCNLSIAQTAESDDMEMTEALEVSVQEKEYTVSKMEKVSPPFSQISKTPSFNVTGNAKIMDENGSCHLPIAQTDNFDDMEMTQCQTIVFEAKQFSGDKQLRNSRKSLPHASISSSVQDEDMKKEALPQIHKPGRMSSINVFRNEDRMSVNKLGNFSVAQTADSDDMEMTEALDVSVQEKEHTASAYPFSQISKNATIHVAGKGKIIDQNKLNHFSMAQTSNFDDMEMTQCQTIVFEAKQFSGDKQLSNLKKSLPHAFISSSVQDEDMKKEALPQIHKPGRMSSINVFRNEDRMSVNKLGNFSVAQTADSDDMEMTEALDVSVQEKEHTASAYPFSQISKNATIHVTGKGKIIDQNKLNHFSIAQTSNFDDMEMTQCQTVVLESKQFNGDKPLNNSQKSLPHVLPSEIKNGDGMDMTQAFTGLIVLNAHSASKRGNGQNILLPAMPTSSKHDQSDCMDLTGELSTFAGIASPSLDEMELTGCATVNINSNRTESDQDNNMQVTKVITMPFETQDDVTFNQREADVETSRNKEEVAEGTERSINSVQLELSSTESVADSFIKEELRHSKSRRRSLADFQMELQNMSRCLNKEVLKGATALLPSCSLPEISHKGKEQCETATSTEPVPNVTPNVKQKDKSFQNDKTTPFSLKKQAFSSRVSFGGIVPKLPKRATAITPNKTMTLSTHDLQCFPTEKRLDVEQNSNCQTVNINDEEFPEMSSEEDMSASLENCPIHKEEEGVGSSAVHKNEEPLENDVFEPDMNISQGLKRPYLEETNVTAEQNKKAYISDMGSDCHEAGVQWEGNFTSHAAQNRSAKTREDTGIFESTLRSSQYESRIDGTLDYEFDFNKKLEDGSITVNEFLSHFSINFVIHRSRPSALPESCRAGETRTMEDLLKEKYIYHPKQRVYEQDCKELTDIVERLREQIPEQEKSLRCINGALQQEICTLSKEQLKSFGSTLKAQRVYFGKRSKAVSHEMKGHLYSQLIKTTQDAKQQLTAKIKETDEMMEDLNGCINDLETELAAIDAVMVGNDQNSSQIRPDLKAKEDDLRKLNSDLTETQRETDELQIQLRTLEGQEQKLQEECSGFKSDLATLNSLNEWRLDETDERGALFTFLHNTVHLQVKLQTPAGREWVTEDVERNMDVSLQLQLDLEKSECHASMVHKLLALHYKSQTLWMQKYPTTRHIPELLHDVSLMVSRLRLLGEEIHQLKRWGGLRLCIRQITCVDTQIHIIFSSLKAFEKFELSLMVTPDYPFGPLQIQNFRSHTGNTRLSQIEVIVSSVRPGKNYLTNILKNIHSELLR